MSVPLITDKDLNSKSGDFFLCLQTGIINNIKAENSIELTEGKARFIDRFFANLDNDIFQGESLKGNKLSDYLSLIGEKVESKDALGAAFARAFEVTKENSVVDKYRLYNKLSKAELACVKAQLDQLLGDFWEYVEKVKAAEIERKAQGAEQKLQGEAQKKEAIGKFTALLGEVKKQKEASKNEIVEKPPFDRSELMKKLWKQRAREAMSAVLS